MLKTSVAAILACLALSACAPGVPVTGSVAPIAFACPAAGTEVRRVGSSAVLRFMGTDPADLSVCRVHDSAGVETRWLYDIIRLPTTLEPEKRAAIANAFQGGPEQCYSETSRGVRGTDINTTYVYEHCWKQGSRSTVEVSGKRYDTAAIIHTEEGRTANAFAADRIFRLDLASKVIVRMDVNNRRGTPIFGYEMAVLKTAAR